MATVGNNSSGRDSAAQIVQNSLYMKHMFKPGTSGVLRPINGELMDLNRDNITGMTMVDTSKFIIIPLTIPEIYAKSGDANLRLMMKGYMKLICDTATSVTLFEQETLEPMEPTMKNALNIPFLTNFGGIPKRISLNIPAEYSGYFIGSVTRHWMRQINDPYSKSSPYNGLTTEFSNYAHTASIAYIKPNPNFTRVDAGAIVLMMAPIDAPTDNLNGDANSPSIPSFSLNFTATVIDYSNKRVYEILTSLLAKYRDYVVMDSTLVGIANDTAMTMTEFDVNDIMNQYKTVE